MVRASGGTSAVTPDVVGDDELLSTDSAEDLIKGLPDAGVWVIQSFEDLFLTTYKDPGASDGLPISGGWGSVLDEYGNKFKLGVTHTKDYWDKLFFLQLRRDYYPQCAEAFGHRFDSLSTMAKGAFLSVAYNCGPDIFTNKYGGYKTTAKIFQSLDLAAISKQILFINRGGDGYRMLGLFRRRYCEGQLMLMDRQPLKAEIPGLKHQWVAEADLLWPKWLKENGD